MTKDSIYRPIFDRREKRLYLGYNYKDNILKNTMSSQMFGVNDTLDTFLGNVDAVVYENIEAVKQIKVFANPALDKYDTKIN